MTYLYAQVDSNMQLIDVHDCCPNPSNRQPIMLSGLGLNYHLSLSVKQSLLKQQQSLQVTYHNGTEISISSSTDSDALVSDTHQVRQ
jgi:hypothetical protein